MAVLLWELEWGPQLASLLDIQRQTGITPRALFERPALETCNRRLYADYVSLAASRSTGYSGPNAISIADMVAFQSLVPELNRERAEVWLRIMQRLDAAVLAKMYQRLKQ